MDCARLVLKATGEVEDLCPYRPGELTT